MYLNQVDFPRLRMFFSDGGYTGKLIDFVKNQFARLAWRLQIVKKAENLNTFNVLPKCWICPNLSDEVLAIK